MFVFLEESPGVILPVFKSLNPYIHKSIMGAVDYLKVLSPDSVAFPESFIVNPNYVHKYLPKIVLCIPLADSST